MSCVDFRGVKCAGLTVPLDRAGVDRGSIDLRVGRAGKPSGPTLMYLSGGPGSAGLSEMLGVVSSLPELEGRFRLIGYDQRGTGRSGLLRCPRLEQDPHLRSTAAAEDCANRLGVARKHYTTADSVEDMEAIRAQLGVEKLTLFGISYGTELALAVRAHVPAARRAADPRLGRRSRRQRSLLHLDLPRHEPRRCGRSARPGATGSAPTPAATSAGWSRSCAPSRWSSAPTTTGGRSHKVTITPLDLMDLMLVTDYLPPLRAILPIAVRSALEGDGALLARMIRDSSSLDELGSPRDFSTARYATVCETEPMPWDPGTPIAQRPAVVQQRIAALPPDTFAPFDPPVVVGDEIDLCLRWPDVPRPPSTVAPLPYPTVPTLILQGGEDLRTPPEVSARIAARIPGSVRLVVPGTGHATVSDPRTCARAAIDRFIAGKSLPKSPCKRIPTGVPAVLGAPESFESLRVPGGLPRKIGRTVQRPRRDAGRPPPGALAGRRSRRPAAACAAGRGRSAATVWSSIAMRPSAGSP